jgi:hypothetical protein
MRKGGSNFELERIDPEYDRIVEYARGANIDLESGWLVWHVSVALPIPLPKVGTRFPDYQSAHVWARKHVNSVRIFITGPHGCFRIIPDEDRETTRDTKVIP